MAGFKRSSIYKNSLYKTYKKVNGKYEDCGRLRAFSCNDEVKIETLISSSAQDVYALFKSDDEKIAKKISLFLEGNKYCAYINLNDVFCKHLGLYNFKFIFTYNTTEFELSESEDEINDSIKYIQRDNKYNYNFFIYEEREKYPKWIENGIIYQIFPDRFMRGRNEIIHDGCILDNDWYNGIPPYKAKPGEKFKNNTFFGGDLYGIGDKMEYISSLGVSCIYLNPIFESYSNHRYDTGDYNKIDDMLGGEDGFKYLLSQADKYNIHIILDGVFNHTGDDSIYFNRSGRYNSIGAYNSKESEYYDWYTFYDFPKSYESWWGFDTLPRVKCDNPKYKEFLFGENGIIRKYLRMGISGYRLDVVDEVSDSFLVELKNAALKEKSDAYIVGEVWENAVTKVSYGNRRKYFSGKELDGVMNYPLRSAIISYLRYGKINELLYVYEHIYNEYPLSAQNYSFNLVSTHDTERILTAICDVKPENISRDEQATKSLDLEAYNRGKNSVKFAYIITNFFPGIPTIYYGDEIGMQGYPDPFNRRPYPWGKEDNELLNFYKKIGEIRKNIDSFKDSHFKIVYIDSDILCIERGNEDNPIIAIINRSDNSYIFSSKNKLYDLFTGECGETFEVENNNFILLKCDNNPGDYSVFLNKYSKEF